MRFIRLLSKFSICVQHSDDVACIDILDKMQILPHDLILYIIGIWKERIKRNWTVTCEIHFDSPKYCYLCYNRAIRFILGDNEIIIRIVKHTVCDVWLLHNNNIIKVKKSVIRGSNLNLILFLMQTNLRMHLKYEAH